MSHGPLNLCNPETIRRYVQRRKGEEKLGEHLRILEGPDWAASLHRWVNDGVRYALIGIPESLGPMANLGRCGSEHAWPAFLQAFLNLQHNAYLNGKSMVCLGTIQTAAINADAKRLDRQHPGSIDRLRQLCRKLDQQVSPVLEKVFATGATPIIIGGGHNNAYPLIRAAALGLERSGGIGCVNVDAHADLRPLEGRHSGNSFHYAIQDGYLSRYFIVGLHEVYATQAMLDIMAVNEQIGFSRFDPGESPRKRLDQVIEFFDEPFLPLGIEIDLDAIVGMPSSARTPSGYTLDQIRAFLRALASRRRLYYLHLPEGAPDPDSPVQMQQTGKSLAYLVSDFIHFQEKPRTEYGGPR